MYILVLTVLSRLIFCAADGHCCKEKTVGGVKYTLKDSGVDTKKYGCLADCTYNDENMKLFCFAAGDLEVSCDDKKYWCYEGDCGVDNWATDFEECGGQFQSPIDIVTNDAVPPAEPVTPLTFSSYDKVNVRVLESAGADELDGGKDDRLEATQFDNNGHTAVLGVMTEGDEDGVMSGGPLGDRKYQMLQMHFHWGSVDEKGSEHTLDGVSYPIELHLVHVNNAAAELDLAVAGFFFEISNEDNPALTPLVDEVTNIMNFKDSFNMSGSSFNIDDLLPDTVGTFYSYSGSLTTPPCAEVVSWIVFKQPLQISASQLGVFRMMMDKNNDKIVDNFRPVMPLNGREVMVYN